MSLCVSHEELVDCMQYKGKLSQFENKAFCFPTVVEIVVLESKKVTRRIVGELMGPSVVFVARDIWHET